MFISDTFYSELIEYFANRPWKEANPFISKLVQARQDSKPVITEPKSRKAEEK